ncbi:MAG: fused MFS/spermidine synthase [Myxococcota bacterium]
MDEVLFELRRERASRWLVPLFFVSGATGLTYQTVWSRELHLVFGTSTLAIATVLAAFMAGLGVGGAWMGRRVDTIARPLRWYGVMEILIGLYAWVFPVLLHAMMPIYIEAGRAGWSTAPLQFLLVGAALLLPTACMGATLPLLARFATERLELAGDRVGLLYATNTWGAVFGTWLCGFVVLPAWGLAATTTLAAVSNVLLGVAALVLDSSSPALTVVDAEVEHLPSVPHGRTVLLVAAALTGFTGLVYEVAWFRLLGLVLGASTYAFSIMLLAFLVGIALGGRWGGRWGDRILEQHGRPALLWTLAAILLMVGVSSVWMMHLFTELPYWYVWWFDWLGADQAPVLVWILSMTLAGVVMMPPAILLGLAFPLTVRACIGHAGEMGSVVGKVYAFNTAGGVLGAALAGFVLLPLLYVEGTIALAAALNLVAAALVVWRVPAAQRVGARVPVMAMCGVVGLTVVCWPQWDPMIMTAGMYKYVTDFEDHSREGITSYAKGQYELLYYREGLSSVVTVARNVDSGNIWLANNGKVDASSTVDMPTQVMVSLLPMQFVASPEDVLVIGLASGVTAGAVTLIDDVKHLEVVELEPATVPAARYFDEYNHGLLDDPRTDLVLEDGRNHVLRAAPGSFDVVISEPSNPWLTGVSNLFTREFFEIGKSRLKDGGVWAQWVQMYGMDDADLRSLLGTFADVYPYVVLYAAAEDADLVLIGSEHPLEPSVDTAASLHRWPRVLKELEVVDMQDPLSIVSTWIGDRAHLLELAGSIQRNTDDNMRIEYRAPLHLHEDTQPKNVSMLYRNARVPWESLGADPYSAAHLASAYWDRQDNGRAVEAMTAAIRALPEDDLDAAAYRTQLSAWLSEVE